MLLLYVNHYANFKSLLSSISLQFGDSSYLQAQIKVQRPPNNLEFVLARRDSLDNFKVCKSVHHHTIQMNQPTRCNNSSSSLLYVYVQLNMSRVSSHPQSGAQQLQQQPLVLQLERGDSSAVGRGRAGIATSMLQQQKQRLLLQLLNS
jgi:hypothetical protein